jgi:hypothetical protein
MDLFSTGLDENQNLLPKDGTVFYYGHMMPLRMPILYLENYWNPWKNDEAVIFGKLIITKEGRLVWRYYFSYTYSELSKP